MTTRKEPKDKRVIISVLMNNGRQVQVDIDEECESVSLSLPSNKVNIETELSKSKYALGTPNQYNFVITESLFRKMIREYKKAIF